MEKAKGRNADRHLCVKCKYRAAVYNKRGAGIKCEYVLKSGTRRSRGCAVEDCDKYARGKPLIAKEDSDV